jgi:hypothetical protein
MREGALFASMFGLGAGAVLVGVTVSRLVVGQPPERSAEEPPPAVAEVSPAVAEVPPPTIVEPPAAAVVESVRPALVAPVAEPPAAVPSATEPAPPPAVERQRRTLVRKHRRPIPAETPFATASVPPGEAETVVPRPTEASHPPIAVVRGGTARPTAGARAPGPRIIHVDSDGGR